MIAFLFAEGFEELEAIAPADILSRSGKDVRFVSVGEGLSVRGAHGFTLNCHMTLGEVDLSCLEMLVLPGGGLGVENLDACKDLDGLLKYCTEREIYLAAICAAPSLLGKRGLLKGKRATCFPGFEKYLYGAEHCDEPLVIDGRVITAKAAGVAVDFGLALSALVTDGKTSSQVGKAIYYER